MTGKITTAQAVLALSQGKAVRVLLKPTDAGLLPAVLKGDAIVGLLTTIERHGRHYALTFQIGDDDLKFWAEWHTLSAFSHQTFWLYDELTNRRRVDEATEAFLMASNVTAEEPDDVWCSEHEEWEIAPDPPEQAKPEDLGMCLWFAMCEQPATHREPHPIFGAVPSCDRCVKIGR